MVAWKCTGIIASKGSPASAPRRSNAQSKLRGDLRRLALFIELYCDGHHSNQSRCVAEIKNHDVTAIARRPVVLCRECARLLAHAFTKRANCPLDPKPSCKHCPVHCYHSDYRARIREVMRYSGRRMLYHGRLDFLLHLLF